MIAIVQFSVSGKSSASAFPFCPPFPIRWITSVVSDINQGSDIESRIRFFGYWHKDQCCQTNMAKGTKVKSVCRMQTQFS